MFFYTLVSLYGEAYAIEHVVDTYVLCWSMKKFSYFLHINTLWNFSISQSFSNIPLCYIEQHARPLSRVSLTDIVIFFIDRMMACLCSFCFVHCIRLLCFAWFEEYTRCSMFAGIYYIVLILCDKKSIDSFRL